MKRFLLTTLFCAIGNVALSDHIDTDSDGLLDLLEVHSFDPNAMGTTSEFERVPRPYANYARLGIQDLDGAHLLSEASVLNLNKNQITSIESGAFQGLSNLQTLWLWQNQITSIESGDFQGLENLQTLDLDENHITSVESGAFQGLSNLQTLRLMDNQITSIESGAFQGLSNLQTLRLYGNQLTNVESRAFQGLHTLMTLQATSVVTELNLTGATFDSLGPCYVGPIASGIPSTGFCLRGQVTSLILDDAVLSPGSLDAILGETHSLTDASMVGLEFSNSNPENVSVLLGIATLDHVTVDQGLFDLYADEFNAFAAIAGNTVVVIPEPSGLTVLLLGVVTLAARGRRYP